MSEARVFADELHEILSERQGSLFSVSLDYATTSRLEEGVRDIFQACRERCCFAGAAKITFVTRDENEAHRLISTRLQQVLDGSEEYVAFGLAA